MIGKGQNHLLIGVMGLTGAGKSHFIKTLTDDPDVVVSKRSKSCTKKVRNCLQIKVGGYTVELVDTPGFGDTELSDSEILNLIAEWLKDSYDDGRKLHGIVYLHDIRATRMSGGAVRSLKIFQNICGRDFLANTIMVTTNWDRFRDADDIEELKEREDEMKEEFWASLIEGGGMYERSYNTKESFHEIISRIVVKPENEPELQKEVGAGKSLNDTAAGAALELDVKAMLKKQMHEFDELSRQATESNQALQDKLTESMAQSKRDLDALSSSFENRSNKKELNTLQGRLATWLTTFEKNKTQQPTVTRQEQFADRLAEITAIKATLSHLGGCEIEGFGEVLHEVDAAAIKAKSKSEEENERVASDKKSLETLKNGHLKWTTDYIALIKPTATITSFRALETRLLAIETTFESHHGKGFIVLEKELAKLVIDSKLKIAESLRAVRAKRAQDEVFDSIKREYKECKIKYDKHKALVTTQGLVELEAVLEELSQLQGALRGLEGNDIDGKKELVTDVNNCKSTLSKLVSSESDRLGKREKREAKQKALSAKYRAWSKAVNIELNKPHNQPRTEALGEAEKVLNIMVQDLNKLMAKDIPEDGLQILMMCSVTVLRINLNTARANHEIEKADEIKRIDKKGAGEMEALGERYEAWLVAINIQIRKPHSQARTEAVDEAGADIRLMVRDLNRLLAKGIPDLGLQKLMTEAMSTAGDRFRIARAKLRGPMRLRRPPAHPQGATGAQMELGGHTKYAGRWDPTGLRGD